MSRFRKILLGIATAWPFAYFFMFAMLILLMIGTGEPGPGAGILFAALIVVHMFSILLILGLQVFYIVNAIKNENFSQNAKIGWILALFFGGLLAMPIYWYMNIWRLPEEDPAGYPGLESGGEFESARDAEWEKRQQEYVPREPHSWK